MNERLKSLYQAVILKHNKTPYHFDVQENYDHTVQANNPVCGDKFQFYIKIKNDQLASVHYHGFGCAISKASNSILVKGIEHLEPAEAYKFCCSFLDYIDCGEYVNGEAPETFEAFSAVNEFPARIECATLGWREMKNFLSKCM